MHQHHPDDTEPPTHTTTGLLLAIFVSVVLTAIVSGLVGQPAKKQRTMASFLNQPEPVNQEHPVAGEGTTAQRPSSLHPPTSTTGNSTTGGSMVSSLVGTSQCHTTHTTHTTFEPCLLLFFSHTTPPLLVCCCSSVSV
jgi:hypothetical protein